MLFCRKVATEGENPKGQPRTFRPRMYRQGPASHSQSCPMPATQIVHTPTSAKGLGIKGEPSCGAETPRSCHRYELSSVPYFYPVTTEIIPVLLPPVGIMCLPWQFAHLRQHACLQSSQLRCVLNSYTTIISIASCSICFWKNTACKFSLILVNLQRP